MSEKHQPDLSLFIDILRTLERIDAQARALGEDVVKFWRMIKEAARQEAKRTE